MAFIRAASALTHAHPRSCIGCGIYACVLEALPAHKSPDAVCRGLAKAKEIYGAEPECAHYARLFDPDFARLSADDIQSTGYVVHTPEAALWCLLTTDSYAACVLKAVCLGNDTDTVGAIAGGLAGALYGLSGIPDAWQLHCFGGRTSSGYAIVPPIRGLVYAMHQRAR